MMNTNGHHGSPAPQPPGPMYQGRRQHDMAYGQPPAQAYPHPYHNYQHAMPQHYYPQPPPPQYYPYPNMGMPMQPRMHHYPNPMSQPYAMQHIPQAMPHRPNPPQHLPSVSSTRSQPTIVSPSSVVSLPQPATRAAPPSPPPAPPPVTRRMQYYPPLPWLSHPDEEFPKKAARARKRQPGPQSSTTRVVFPRRAPSAHEEEHTEQDPAPEEQAASSSKTNAISVPHIDTPSLDTPFTSVGPSDTESPHSPVSSTTQQSRTPAAVNKSRPTSRPGVVVPVIPNIPSLPRLAQRPSTSGASETKKEPAQQEFSSVTTTAQSTAVDEVASEVVTAAIPAPVAPPKSWADLVRTKGAVKPAAVAIGSDHDETSNSVFGVTQESSLADFLAHFSVRNQNSENKISFIKPRGLVNTGNMCYMNSVLQVLIYCVPFYDFLQTVSKHAKFSFNSRTPMVDAMINFMQEFETIDSATSAKQLQLRLKAEELEQFGSQFTPEYVYDVIKRLPRFASMRRGQQQDAQEFLGFLLEEMHEECAKVILSTAPKSSSTSPGADDFHSPTSEASGGASGWLEVGPKQRSAITRSSGTVSTESPITKIFGGKLRSELRVPGAKNSVTLEPYQPLQLDIGPPHVNNIIEALKGLTQSETLHGDFNSPRGPGVAATKQVFIESLPPVLILHLKRFQYNNAGGAQKIWKKIGYPLELELPKEVFPPHKRNSFAAHGGLPRYRLIGVIYHHGKNANGGHYTVDVRRQDGNEWIRLDDTVIRRVRSEDVAEGGSEEDPKVLAAALEQHKRDESSSSNIFDQMREESEEQVKSDAGWSQVNGGAGTSNAKKWSGVVNGAATPSSSGLKTPTKRPFAKDSKVAYLLFYQKLGY